MSSMPQPQSQLADAASNPALASPLDARVGSTRRAWWIACAVVALLAGVFWLHQPSSISLMELWNDTSKTTYTHGYVIAGLVVWLILRRRQRLAWEPWSPSILAALLVAATGVAWIVAVRSGIEIVHQLLLLALLWLSVWAVFGRRIAVTLALPIGYLIFAIPVWDQVNSLLQAGTVAAVQFFLKLSSIPAYVEGNFVHLAAGVFEIAGGCSGIHFYIVSLAVATLYGEIGRDSLKTRLSLIGLAAGLALLTNWLRVYIIVVAGHLTNMQHYLVRVEHYQFGWVVFAVMMTLFFLIARRFAPAVTSDSGAPADSSTRGVSFGLGLAIATLAVLAVPCWELARPVQPAALSADAVLPGAPSGWSQVATESSQWNPVFEGADRIARGEYAGADDRRVEAFVASYALQHQNKELVAYGNSLIGPGEGTIVSVARTGTTAPAKELIVNGPRERAVIRYYYRIGGLRTDRGIVAQLSYGLSAIRNPTPSSVIAVRSACRPDCDAARALLDEFAAAAERSPPHEI
jgi:exosortase A